MSMQGSLSIEQMCRLSGVSRAGFYRSLQERMPVDEDMEVRSTIQEIAVEHRRRYGYRRIAAELRRRGMLVNHKRVARIMREDNLLAVQPKAFVVTTDFHHALEVYLNLAGRMKLTGINQLWVADITYIRLHREFVYLAVILDAYSRKVVGWNWTELWLRGWRLQRWRKPSRNGSRLRAWCTTPIAECSMPATIM
jgi:putative transposase